MAVTNKYSADEIKINLLDSEKVRQNPQVYISTPDSYGRFIALKEVIDNSKDEAINGHGKEILLIWDKDNNFWVKDSGRGIPVDKHKKTKRSVLEAIMTTLSAGGKMQEDGKASAYTNTVGIHGMGVSITNALSESMQVWSYRNGWFTQAYKKGKILHDVKKTTKPTLPFKTEIKNQGTITKFKLDDIVFEKGSSIESDRIQQFLELSSYLYPKITFIFNDKGKIKTYHEPKGLASLVEKEITKKEFEKIGKPFVFQDSVCDIIIQWTSYEETSMLSFVNGSPTSEGGTHLQGFYKALAEVLRKLKNKKDDFKAEDVRYGIIGVFNINVNKPKFSNQTKEKLTTPEILDAVYKETLPKLTEFFAKNKTLAKNIIKRAVEIRQGVERLQMTKKAAASLKVNKNGKTLLPAKLIQSIEDCPHKRELFLCEGESAEGCFLGETEVLLSNRSTITYEDMYNGYKIGKVYEGISYNLETKEFEPFIFDEPRIIKYVDKYLEVELSDGTIWKCTYNHPWLLATGFYVKAEDLFVSDVLLQFNTQEYRLDVTSIKMIEPTSKIPVYDATSPKNHNYALGNGAIVHNTAKDARDKTYQEILSLRGKVLNVYKDKKNKIFSSKPIRDILQSIGYDGTLKDPLAKLRVKKIVILTDPDPDGAHISVLIASVLQKIAPELFDRGIVYEPKTSLYVYQLGNDKVYGKNINDLKKKVNGTFNSDNVTRIKGLGEVGPSIIRDMAFNPKTRTLVKISPVKGGNLKLFLDIVSEDSSSRKEILGIT